MGLLVPRFAYAGADPACLAGGSRSQTRGVTQRMALGEPVLAPAWRTLMPEVSNHGVRIIQRVGRGSAARAAARLVLRSIVVDRARIPRRTRERSPPRLRRHPRPRRERLAARRRCAGRACGCQASNNPGVRRERHAFASSRRRSRSVTTTKSQACWFIEEGVRRPASRIRSRSSSGIARSSYVRTFRRARIASPRVEVADDSRWEPALSCPSKPHADLSSTGSAPSLAKDRAGRVLRPSPIRPRLAGSTATRRAPRRRRSRGAPRRRRSDRPRPEAGRRERHAPAPGFILRAHDHRPRRLDRQRSAGPVREAE